MTAPALSDPILLFEDGAKRAISKEKLKGGNYATNKI